MGGMGGMASAAQSIEREEEMIFWMRKKNPTTMFASKPATCSNRNQVCCLEA